MLQFKCVQKIKKTHIIKIPFVVPTDAHNYKIVEMLKQLKITTLPPTCLGSRRNHHQGAVQCLAKTTKFGFPVLIGIGAVNVHISLLCRREVNRTPAQQADMPP
jgi:hypothetical protein